MMMNLAWVTRRGTHCHERVEAATLPERLKKLYARRLEAVAWLNGERDHPSGGVEKDPTFRWVWWYYAPDCREEPIT